MKYRLKIIRKNFYLYMGLPHIWILIVVGILAISACTISIIFKESNQYISSLFSNIFSGLITGVVICLISTIKSAYIYKSECLIKWLEELQKMCWKFIVMYRKLCSYKPGDFDNNDSLYDYVYDTLCCGNDISSLIIQGQYNKALPFNPCKYCKRKLSFDANEVMDSNNVLHDKVIEIDICNITSKQLSVFFNNMGHQIIELNSDIIKNIDELNAKKKALNLSIL